ncbi:tubulin-specific chaperone cofactor E-like protein [Ptychodera flava]|uniref:tubulin-specific chaperone cofactor E-like protein n=1 Tax=Ptychodera flava TaxID=63121 RepID=UPI00396A73CC
MATSSEASSSALPGGVSVPDAFKAKYSDHSPENFDYISIAVPNNKANSMLVPACLTLNDCCIDCAGNDGEIAQLCTGVRELDLAKNNLQDWTEVISVISQLPDLEFLNLGSNPLMHSIPPGLVDTVSMATIKRLVLNNTGVKWEIVHELLRVMTGLEEIHLSLNNFGTVEISDDTYPKVKMFQFNNNSITDFREICKLGKMFPGLEHLYLIENNIKDLSGDIPASFPCLKCISLSGTEINSWEALEKFNLFPTLTDIRMKGLPLLKKYPEVKRRPLVVARLPRVTRLNGSRVLDEERLDAERLFIRHYMKKKPEQQPQRYHDLVAIHGKLDELVDLDLRPTDWADCVIKFESKQTLMKVNTTQTVSEFKKTLGHFAELPVNRFRLFHLEQEMNEQGFMEEIRYNTLCLHSYRVKDGDEFHIVPKIM